ncbi:uncharacterized protein [Leptinotarsa decemlineata]|uniref:uncharacterized protein n=1 Tax=Leptinotarsa decemlineata TaxID=7539 RepID=UPI003D3048F6
MFVSAGSVLKLHALSDNLHSLEPVAVYKPRKSYGSACKLTNVSWCHDNSYIALLQDDGHPEIVSCKDRTNLNLVHTIQSLKRVTSLSFKQNTKRILALGNHEGEVVLYDTKNRGIARKIVGLSSPVRMLEFNSRDEQIFVGGDAGSGVFSDHDGINNFTKEIALPDSYTASKFHPLSPSILALGDQSGRVFLRDTEKDEVISSTQRHTSTVTGIAFTGDHKIMVTTGMDNKICVNDCQTSDCVFRMNIHQAITSSDVSPDDRYIAAGIEDGCVYIYDIREPLKPLVCTNAHDCAVNKIAFERAVPCAEIVREKPSVTTLNESEFGENHSEVSNSMGDIDRHDAEDEKFKKELLRMVKSHMSYLETQLAEHCAKFQSFIANEFDAIHNAMARWDVFNVGDTAEIAQAIDSTDSRSSRSGASVGKSRSQMRQ